MPLARNSTARQFGELGGEPVRTRAGALVSAVVVMASVVAAVACVPRPPLAGTIDVPLAHDPAGCDPLGGERCYLPFPNDYFTVPDRSTGTGRRVRFAADTLPANTAGVHIDPTELNRNDGFSPGSAIAVLLPGLDLAASGAAPATDMARSLDRRSPIVIVDAKTGERHPHWAELDAGAPDDAHRLLFVRPSRELPRGAPLHRGAARPGRHERRRHRPQSGVPCLPRPARHPEPAAGAPPGPHGGPVRQAPPRRRPPGRAGAGLGLHGGQRAQPVRAGARHARPRLRAARTQRAELPGHRRGRQHPREPAPRGVRHLPGAQLPDRDHHRRGPQQRQRGGLVADPAAERHAHRPVHLHGAGVRGRRRRLGPADAGRALRPRPAGQRP